MTMLKHQPETRKQEPEQLLSFEHLYDQYHLRIFRYLRAHLKNDDDAADLTQQVFFQVWLRLPTYQSEKGAFSAWLFSIARHRLIDFLRTIRSATPWETSYEIALTDLDPEAIVISAESITLVKTLIDALSPAERELLALRFAARLSMAEIALLIGKSEEATKKQIARLLRRLQERYRRQENANPRGWQLPIFLAVLQQVYAVSLPVARLTFSRMQISPTLSHRRSFMKG